MSRELVPIETDVGKIGPALAALPDRQRRFVEAIVELGVTNTKAAELAGYTGDANTLKATGYRLAHDARVQEAIHETAVKLVRSTAIMAVGVLKEIAEGTFYDPRVRVKAATELLNRSGLSATVEHKVTVEVSEKDQLQRIRIMAEQLGLDPVKLIGQAGYVVDAEFTVVRQADQPADGDDWTVYPPEREADHG